MGLSSKISTLKGVGPKRLEALAKAGLVTVDDLIHFLPRKYSDFSEVLSISELKPGNVVVRATCESISTRPVRRGLRLTTAVLSDGTGKVKAVWFNQPYRETQLKPDRQFLFSGEFAMQYNQYQLTNPSVQLADDAQTGASEGAKIVPIYRQVKGLKPAVVHGVIGQLRPVVSAYPESLPQQMIEKYQLVSKSDALSYLHFPSEHQDIADGKKRLAFEELFEMLLASQLNKQEHTKLSGWPIPFDQPTIKRFVEALPFKLTNAQRRVAWQILQDLESEHPMNRLLQGDVGSGKTVVAGLIARQVAQAGLQTAIMAPTEILAEQHADTLSSLLSPFGVKIALLTGSVKGVDRRELLQRLESGEIDVVVGTHALIQPTVKYHRLGFVVIDEQHRFGVKQRQSLLDKSYHMPHLLSMTATPIPRSLALTLYGELDVSVLNELPAGRRPIATKIWSPVNTPKLYENIEKELTKGHQVYIICGLIDDNPENDRKSVEAEHRRLKNSQFHKYQIGLLHGRLTAQEKELAMRKFSSGETNILVSTTVVEVGVNVPNATVMVIENADFFGLSQLHQLRGRVGRSDKQSYCHLVMSDNDKPSARLREVEKSQDGFYLAEVDLKLRGPGEVYGQAQHGALRLQIASLADTALISLAQEAAKQFVASGEDLLQYKQLNEAVRRYQRLTTLN